MLFIIPKTSPPSLTGSFTESFKDFVACCLQTDPLTRPSAKQLLKHRFIRSAKKLHLLQELLRFRVRDDEDDTRSLTSDDDMAVLSDDVLENGSHRRLASSGGQHLPWNFSLESHEEVGEVASSGEDPAEMERVEALRMLRRNLGAALRGSAPSPITKPGIRSRSGGSSPSDTISRASYSSMRIITPS